MAVRRSLAPLLAIAVAYAGFLVGVFFLTLLIRPEYQHTDSLNRGLVFLAWSLLSLIVVAVSCTSLVFVWKSVNRWLRVATVVLNLPVVAVAPFILVVSIWSLQDYAASYAAYDTATQVCGHPPVIAETGWAPSYTLPNTFDYERLKYSTHDRFIFGGTVYYCTAADAEAHGLRPYP